MKRPLALCATLASVLALTAAAGASARPAAKAAAGGTVTGAITLTGGSSFTIQTPGRSTGVVNALSVAADRVTARDYPYVYGGGHGEAGVASVGLRGLGYNGHRVGYDCSGSVAAVLAGAGLWPTGSGVPSDAGIIAELLSRRLIARGAGAGPVEVTLYDDPGVHIFMNIDGRFFGTSDGGGGGNPRGGAGWLNDGAPDAGSRRYRRYHVPASVLHQRTVAGHFVTFLQGNGTQLLPQLGQVAAVGYRQTPDGTLVATSITYAGAVTATGTVQAIAPDAGSLTVQTSSGAVLELSTDGVAQVLAGVAVGDTVQLSYTASAGILTVHQVAITATPQPPAGDPGQLPPAGSPGPPAPGGPPATAGQG